MNTYKAISTMRYIAMKSDALVAMVHKLKGKERDTATARRIIQHDGIAIAAGIQEALMARGIVCPIAAGSLLGVIREGKFLNHDDDIDFAVLLDAHFSWEAVEEAISALGYRLTRTLSINGRVTEHTYDTGKGVCFDIFGLTPHGATCSLYYYAQRKDQIYEHRCDQSVWEVQWPIFDHADAVEVQGHTLYIPSNPEEILACSYGPDWRIPDTGWNPKTAFKHLDGAIGKITEYE